MPPKPTLTPSKLRARKQVASGIAAAAASLEMLPADDEGDQPLREFADTEQSLKLQEMQEQITAIQKESTRNEKIHAMRLSLVKSLFALVVGWVVAVILILSATGASEGGPCKFFKLSDTVLITFITSTTVSVLGLFGIAARWLYPGSGKTEVLVKSESTTKKDRKA